MNVKLFSGSIPDDYVLAGLFGEKRRTDENEPFEGRSHDLLKINILFWVHLTI